MSAARLLPFSVPDHLLNLFLHRIEVEGSWVLIGGWSTAVSPPNPLRRGRAASCRCGRSLAVCERNCASGVARWRRALTGSEGGARLRLSVLPKPASTPI